MVTDKRYYDRKACTQRLDVDCEVLKRKWEIMKLLEEVNDRGTTVIVVTHNMEIVKVMKKRVITVQKGVIVSDSKAGD